jgi:hypothetical protein
MCCVLKVEEMVRGSAAVALPQPFVERSIFVEMNERGSLSHVDKAELIKWLDALRVIQSRAHSLIDGVELARKSTHPDAVWLCARVASRGLSELANALADEEPDARTLFFRARLVGSAAECVDAMRKVAEMGYAHAQAVMAVLETGESEKRAWSELAAAQGSREGLLRLSYFLSKGVGGPMDKERGFAALQQAAELEEREAMHLLYRDFRHPKNLRYRSLCRAAALGCDWAVKEVVNFVLPSVKKRVLDGQPLLQLGAALKGGIDGANSRVLGASVAEPVIGTALQCVALYEGWMQQVRAAIDLWTVVARRAGLVKDVRLFVARGLWSERAAWMTPWTKLEKEGCVLC